MKAEMQGTWIRRWFTKWKVLEKKKQAFSSQTFVNGLEYLRTTCFVRRKCITPKMGWWELQKCVWRFLPIFAMASFEKVYHLTHSSASPELHQNWLTITFTSNWFDVKVWWRFENQKVQIQSLVLVRRGAYIENSWVVKI